MTPFVNILPLCFDQTTSLIHRMRLFSHLIRCDGALMNMEILGYANLEAGLIPNGEEIQVIH